MNPIKEAIEKTGINLVGLVNGINEFTAKPTVEDPNPKTYWSADLIVKGHKQAITIKLPEGYDRTKIGMYDIISIAVKVGVFNGKTSFTII